MSSFIAVFPPSLGGNRAPPLISQHRFCVTHCERVVGDVLPEFRFRHRACFLIPDVAGNLPRRIWLAIYGHSEHDKFAVAKGRVPTVMLERFYNLIICSTDSHVAARITRNGFEWEYS